MPIFWTSDGGIDTNGLSEKAALKKVLSACFDAINNSNYFIVFVGNNYGSCVPHVIIDELERQHHFIKRGQNLLNKGYKLFKSAEVLANESHNAHHYFDRENYKSRAEWESDVNGRRHYLLRVYGLYLVPEEEIQNVKIGTLLVSSIDAKEIICDRDLDWKVENGFSQYGIRLMPTYYDELLLCGNQNPSVP